MHGVRRGVRGRPFLGCRAANTAACTADKGSRHDLMALSVLTMIKTPAMVAAAWGRVGSADSPRKRPPGVLRRGRTGDSEPTLGGDHVAGRCPGSVTVVRSARRCWNDRGRRGPARLEHHCRPGDDARAGTVRHDAPTIPAGLAQASPPKWTRLVAGGHGGHAKPAAVATATGPSCCRCDSSR